MKWTVFLSMFIVLMVFGFMSCETDKTSIGFEEEEECWNSKVIIHDYDYLKNQYFFVDTYYKDYFEQGWTDDLSNWVYDGSKLLIELEVFKTASYSDPNARKGIAVLNPQNYNGLTPSDYDTVNSIPGKVEKTYLTILEEGTEYHYSGYMGFFGLHSPVGENEILAVSYKMDLHQVGTHVGEFLTDTTKLPVFRLIKSTNLTPDHEDLWPLMMKNIYYLEDNRISRECFNIQIEYNLNGEHQTIQPVDPKESYAYLLGLDRIDENGAVIGHGDGIVDNNGLLINRNDGILIFPGLQPFNPSPLSRFQIADTTNLYDTNHIVTLWNRHKYNIIVTSKVED